MIRWIHSQIGENGEPLMRLGRDREFVVAEWTGLGRLVSNRAGTWSEFTPEPGASPGAVDKFASNLVVALLRHLRGELTLHASSVALGVRAIGCTGASGKGKSTLAAALCARHGGRLLADDGTHLEPGPEGFVVIPTDQAHWLSPQSAAMISGSAAPTGGAVHSRAKSPFPAPTASAPTPLTALVNLDYSDESASEPTLRRLRGFEGFRVLASSLFRFVVDDPAVQKRELDQLMAIAIRIPVYTLSRPRNVESLDRCCQLMLQLAT